MQLVDFLRDFAINLTKKKLKTTKKTNNPMETYMCLNSVNINRRKKIVWVLKMNYFIINCHIITDKFFSDSFPTDYD